MYKNYFDFEASISSFFVIMLIWKTWELKAIYQIASVIRKEMWLKINFAKEISPSFIVVFENNQTWDVSKFLLFFDFPDSCRIFSRGRALSWAWSIQTMHERVPRASLLWRSIFGGRIFQKKK